MPTTVTFGSYQELATFSHDDRIVLGEGLFETTRYHKDHKLIDKLNNQLALDVNSFNGFY